MRGRLFLGMEKMGGKNGGRLTKGNWGEREKSIRIVEEEKGKKKKKIKKLKKRWDGGRWCWD